MDRDLFGDKVCDVLKTLRFGILALGASISFLPGCTGEAFTALDDPGTVDAGTDASSDAAPTLDAGKDASKDVEADALEDAGTDGEADAGADADEGDSDADGGDGAPNDEDAGDAGDPDDAGDAAPDALDDACEPLTWYADADGDGFGVESESIQACDHPGKGWATQQGDCDDANPDVNPGQVAYFAHGYIHSSTSKLSFDYDCSGVEENEAKPISSQANCQAPSLGSCTGTGYLKVNPARPEADVNQFCGSTTYRTCTPILNLLACEPPSIDSSATPLGCR